MRQPPRVGVIATTYNWRSVLRYAIESVLRQTLGCIDDSTEIVTSFNDPRFAGIIFLKTRIPVGSG